MNNYSGVRLDRMTFSRYLKIWREFIEEFQWKNDPIAIVCLVFLNFLESSGIYWSSKSLFGLISQF